jgi:Lar family restriction alleviation protein
MKLKKCPFCGGEPVLIEAMGEVWYNCTDCCASVNMATSEKEAARLWNKRCHGVCDTKQRKAELAKSRGLLVTAISIIRNNVSYTKSPAWDSVRMAIKDIDEHLMKEQIK